MKKLVLVAVLFATSAVYAQKNKAATQPAVVYSSSQKVIGGNIGMNQSALNVGVLMDSGPDNGDLGGSFFLQTEKKDNGTIKVYQVMTFGAHTHLHVYDQANWIVDLRPGVNLSMINDVANNSGGKDNKTTIGPSFRWSITHRLDSGFEIGIDHLQIWNWFDADVAKDNAYTSLAFRTRF